MQKNILQLHKKLTNVVDLHDTYPVLGREGSVVDLRQQKNNFDKEKFRRNLSKKTSQSRVKRTKLTGRTNYFSSIYKTLAIVLLVSLNSFALSQVGSTFSIFNDIELSEGNSHTAGVIDFALDLSPFSNEAWRNLVEGTSTAQDIDVLPNEVSNPFFYYASSTNFTGDQAFCDAVQVIATLDGDLMYDGPLVEFFSPTTTNIATWNLEFSNEQKFFNSACHFDIDFNGWQTRHGYPNYHDGFSDTESTSHWLFSDGLKINKVYFEADELICRMDVEDHFLTEDDPRLVRGERERQDRWEYWPHPDRECYDRRGREDSPRNSTTTDYATTTINAPLYEWVELYNPNEEPADIDGWFLCDGQECDVLNVSEPIPPLGFAIVVGEIGDLEGWITPSDFVIVVTDDGVIGDGLDNENDALSLRRPDFFTFDQVNWGVPDPTWPYFESNLWNPGIASTSDGTMIARIPTGFDTNQPSDFEVLGIPFIDLLYPADVVEGKWFWGFTYLVTWLATNPNGDDSELLIDIWMIRDTNFNDMIDGEDEHILLIPKTENDGNEEVTVPDGFLGNIWIKIIATGPENPMTHGFDISGIIEDPIPSFMLDDEENMEVMQQAVIDQINREGESDFAHLLVDPIHLRPEVEPVASSTPLESEIEENSASSTLEATTTTESIVDESVVETEEEESVASTTASTTPEAIEDSTFEEEITELIDEFVAEHAVVILKEDASTTTDMIEEQNQEPEIIENNLTEELEGNEEEHEHEENSAQDEPVEDSESDSVHLEEAIIEDEVTVPEELIEENNE